MDDDLLYAYKDFGASSEPWDDAPHLHGEGDTKGDVIDHERRHVRVLNGLNIRHDGYRVWREGGVWGGETYINRSAANMRRWHALTPAQQAAVYIAGAMGPRGVTNGCGSDLREVDARASRGAAKAVARRYL